MSIVSNHYPELLDPFTGEYFPEPWEMSPQEKDQIMKEVNREREEREATIVAQLVTAACRIVRTAEPCGDDANRSISQSAVAELRKALDEFPAF